MFVRKKRKGNTVYYELVRTVRRQGNVRQEVLKYFGSLGEATEYCEKHGLKPPKRELIERRLASRIAGKLERLNSLHPLPRSTLESLREKLEVEMTYHSNAIEGNRLTLRETWLVLKQGMTIGGKSVEEHLEATNHREAISLLEGLTRRRHSISEADVLRLHAVILDKIKLDAGQYRRGRVFIAGAEHVPPSPKLVPEFMKEVLQELNSSSKGVDAVISAAHLHHKLAWIHPFTDGNGRLARLLTNLRLMRAGFPPVVLKKSERRAYYSALEKADAGDLVSLTMFIAGHVEKALDLYLEAAGV
jgi:Fic family protein